MFMYLCVCAHMCVPVHVPAHILHYAIYHGNRDTGTVLINGYIS